MDQRPKYEELANQVRALQRENNELRKAKQEIKESEAFHRSTLENISDTVVITDDFGKTLYACPNAYNIFGLSQNQIYKKETIHELINGTVCDISELREKKEISNIEWRVIDSAGQEKFTLITAKAVSISGGTVLYVIRDITARKQAQEALQENKQFMTSLLKAIPLPVFFKDRKGKYIACNDTFTEIMGVTEEDIKGKTVYDLWPTEQAKEYHEKDLELIKSGEHQEYEFVVQDKNGQIRPVIYMKDVFNNTKGEPAGLVGAFLDITERKKVEEALKSNYALLKIAGETAKFGGWSVDLKKNICTLSDAVADILDVPRGYAPPMQETINFYAPEWREKITQIFSACAKEGIPYDEELEIMTQKGKRVWVRTVTKAVKNTNGRIIKVQGSFQDITESKQAEAKILYLQKSESLGRMAGAIAHNFNNQLSVVMGNLELVLSDLPGDAKIRKNLFKSFEAARKAANQSMQMLRYLGHISGNQTTIDLSDICRQSLPLLQSTAKKDVTLNVDFPDSGPFVHADTGQIQQVLINLFTNAQESLPDKQGVIGLGIQTISHEDISTSNRFPLDWQPQDIFYACLEISDTGCGISMKDIVKLFDPFYTTKFTGRGMGLSVIMGILKAHGSCIIVDSKPGCGSVFRVYLPIAAAKKTVTHEKLTTPKRNVVNGGTVLLIEDEAGVRNTAKIMINRLGYTVIEAQDGVEAVKLFQERQNEIDCVLSDLTMPRMNGWETLTELRRMGADVPVILASGYDKESVMSGDHPELPQGFLNKPYSMSALKEVLMEVIRL